MCGLFAAIGRRPVADALIQGLKRLEYRGYDSAGIVTLDDGALRRLCAVGKVSELEKSVGRAPPQGHIGLAHTRWATHGAPSMANSHPHLADGVAVVHNGIVENHGELRSKLQQQGCSFTSETDSEVIPWLISRSVGGGASSIDHEIPSVWQRRSHDVGLWKFLTLTAWAQAKCGLHRV